MGRYAAILNRYLVSGKNNAVPVHPDSLIIVSLYDISDSDVRMQFPDCSNIILILDHLPAVSDNINGDTENLNISKTNDINTGIIRIKWDHARGAGFNEQARKLLRKNCYKTAMFLHSQEAASGRLMLALRTIGVRKAIFEESGSLREISITKALLYRIKSRTVNLLLPSSMVGKLKVNSVSTQSLDQWNQFILDDNITLVSNNCISGGLNFETITTDTISDADKYLIWQYTGCLNSGGAERQVVNLAIGLARQPGITSEVYTSEPLTGARGHFKSILENNSIKTRQAGFPDNENTLDALTEIAAEYTDRIKLINSIPAGIRTQVLDLVGELLLHKPVALNCWLDYNNIIGGLAGLIAGVPVIVLSTRNVNPSYFPEFYQPWMPVFYKILKHSKRIKFVSNSKHGAVDYAAWLNMSPDKYAVIHNGVKHNPEYYNNNSELAAFRTSINILDPVQPLIAGVFRLSPEKRPELFVKVIKRVYQDNPDIKAVIAGIGPLYTQIKIMLEKAGLQDVVHLLGQRDDIPIILAAANLMLLTSKQEGLPNCVLEAMACKCPVVAAGNDGTNEIITDGVTGILREGNNIIEALAQAVNNLLTDTEYANRLASAAYKEIITKYSCEMLVKNSLAVYQSVLDLQESENRLNLISH